MGDIDVAFFPMIVVLWILSIVLIKFFKIEEKIALVLAYIVMAALVLVFFDSIDALMINFFGLLLLIWIVSIESNKQKEN